MNWMTTDKAAVLIRDADEDDREGIMRLLGRWLDEGMAANPARPRPTIEYRKHSHLLVALEGGTIVGFVSADLIIGDGSDAEIPKGGKYLQLDDIYVLPERRGKGIGGALLEALVGRGRKEGVAKSVLEIESLDQDRAVRFYSAHGYRPLGSGMWEGKPRLIRGG